jgi:predicted thioesterase
MLPIPDGHTFSMRLRVTRRMTARFFECEIHPLYATFAIVEHFEYASRQAILRFVEPEEDALGSAVAVTHRSAVPVGAVVAITARVMEVDGSRIVCRVEAESDGRMVAEGTIEQRVVMREKLDRMIETLYRDRGIDAKQPTAIQREKG